MRSKKNTLVFLLMFIPAFVFAQKENDQAEIQKQAVEMREKINKYMADKLLVEEKKKDSSVHQVIDSISQKLAEQHLEIERLKQQFAKIEQALISGDFSKLNGSTQNGVVPNAIQTYDQERDSIAVRNGFQYHGDKQLNLYFPFDRYGLTRGQKEELRKFLAGKNIKLVYVSGYTDWIGTENHNFELGKNRCNTVIKILNEMVIHYKVNSDFKCNNYSDFSSRKARWCRRVEIVIVE